MGRFPRLGPSSERVRAFAPVLAFGVLYLIMARAGISLLGSLGVSGFSGPLVWPASGLYVAALLAAEWRLWPLLACAALLGSLGAHLDAGSSLAVSLGFAVPNAVEGAFAALLVRRGAGRRSFARPGDIGALVFGGVVLGGAVLSLSAAAVARYGTSAPFGGSWVRWWTADGLGMLLVAPLAALTPAQLRRVNPRAEAATAVVVAGASVATYIACAVHPWDAAGVLGAALALPFAFLAGWRWGPGGAVAAILPVAIASGTRGAHDGTFFASGGAASVHVLAVQGAFAAVTLAALIATTGAAQRARLSGALGTARGRLQRLLDLTSDACVSLDVHGTITAWNRRAEALFGWPAAEALEMSIYETLVAPSGADSWMAALARETAGDAGRSPTGLPAWHRAGHELRVEVVVVLETGGADLFFRDVSERQRLRGDVQRLAGELDAKGRDLVAKDRDLVAKDRDLEAKGRDLVAKDRDLVAKGRDLEAKSRDLERTLREREQLRGNLARAHGQQAQTERELADRGHALSSAERRVEKLEHDLRRTIELRDRAVRDASRERDALEQKLSSLDRGLAEARRVRDEVAAELDEIRRLRAETDAELERERRTRVETETELERERQGRGEIAAALTGTQVRVHALAAELDDMRQRAMDAERALQEAKLARAAYDRRGICIYASPAWRDAFGWDNDELVGQQGSRLIHPGDRPLIQRARAQRSESRFEARILNKQGGFTRAEATFRPVRDHDGSLIGIEAILRPRLTQLPAPEPNLLAEAHYGPRVRPPLRMV